MRVEEEVSLGISETKEIKKNTHKIIVGFFSIEQNAYLLDKLLKDKGFSSHIENWKQYKRVYVDVQEGSSVEEISAQIEQLVGQKGVVLKNEN